MLTVRPRYNHWFPSKVGAGAITLYPYVFFAMSRADAAKEHVITHELQHVRQVRQRGWLWFYLDYVLQMAIGLYKFKSWNKAYMAISWEVEAYALQEAINPTESELKEFGF